MSAPYIIENFNKAIKIKNYVEDYLGRGYAYMQLGQKDKAVSDLQTFLNGYPDHEFARQLLREIRGY